MNKRIDLDPPAGPPRRIYDLLTAAAGNAEGLAAAGPNERLTYAQFASEVDLYAKALLALGVARGDRLAMLTAPAVDFWRLMHAATSIGAIWLGINPRYQSRDFKVLMEDAQPSVVIVRSPDDGRSYTEELQPLLSQERS